jgi:3',5'-cyclic AMP phosphodiesterase CpdA
MQKCLRAVEALDPKPDLILTGGDLVYDVMGQGIGRSKMLFDLYKQTVADNTNLKAYPCVGNHDVLGWSDKPGVTPQHPQYGKQLIRDELEMKKTYYRFDHKGWRFYVLDSIQPVDHPRIHYKGGFDDEQFEWLKSDLAAKDPNMPAVVVTHIPILSVTGIRDSPQVIKDGYYRVGGSWMFIGAAGLTKLFAKHNVKLALSGHMHEIDRIDFGGVTFICDGAVCGGWWRGPNVDNVVETQEGFGIVDMLPDGTFAHQYYDYGWQVPQ